jgi:hypothetical protein
MNTNLVTARNAFLAKSTDETVYNYATALIEAAGQQGITYECVAEKDAAKLLRDCVQDGYYNLEDLLDAAEVVAVQVIDDSEESDLTVRVRAGFMGTNCSWEDALKIGATGGIPEWFESDWIEKV